MFFPALLICFPRLPPPGGAWQGRGGFNCSFQLATKTCHPELCPSRAEGREVSAPPTAYPNYLLSNYLLSNYLLSNYLDTHGAGGSAHTLDRGFDRGGVQVGQLLLGYVFHLLRGHFADLVFVRRT